MKNFVSIILTLFCFKLSVGSERGEPRILSSLYGYDNCIGGVKGLFQSQEDYLEDLRLRNCTVENGHTNVASQMRLKLPCKNIFGSFQWLDGMPLVFNYPLETTPKTDDIELELSDGSVVNPVCVMMGPANEKNELDTALILGQFGDGPLDTLRPVSVKVVGDIQVVTEDGVVSGKGITYSSEADMNYIESSVRLVYAKMWSVVNNSEIFHYPMWPLPSKVCS